MKDILVVEDGKQERERLVKLFSDAGYSVLAFENVTDAEACLQNEHFRLAVLDIGLEDRSGSYLFGIIKRNGSADDVIIFTGNPSVHLRRRFIDEGACDYIVKASIQSQDDNFLMRVKEIIGEPLPCQINGIELSYFMEHYLSQSSRQFFVDDENHFFRCTNCGSQEYVVSFTDQTQMPPEILGVVVCASCGTKLDPKIE